MPETPRVCKNCGVALTESNAYPSDWRHHVNCCKSCKQKTFARLRERSGGVSVSTNVSDVLPPSSAEPSFTTTDPDANTLTEEEIELLHDLRIVRHTTTWKHMVREGKLEQKLNESPPDPDDEE
jgi:hypothetical protein